jgi:1-aminocyclopropane-1-carboxylate deaminase/D-cysteine desulfhydrase-like pyridoxal-dependent ACC family enzyme
VSGGDPAKSERAAEIANHATELLGSPVRLVAGDFETDQSQIGPGYGLETPACLEAISLLARTEGILLDPVYTGKAMAGLLADIRAGLIPPSETVVFLHTGGLPGIFAHAQALAASVGATTSG